jgi:thiamine pyrophosphokinase
VKQAAKCVIIAGGDVQEKISVYPDFLVICADGGYRHALAQNIKPDVLIGDFDSYTDELPEDIKIIRYPVEKDISDTWACVEYAKQHGCQFFNIYGAFGGDRIDHSIANFQLIRRMAEENLDFTMFYKNQRIINLHAGYGQRLRPDLNSYFSVFALSDTCKGVTIKGAKYPLENAALKNNFPLGLSNEFIGEYLEISVKEGNLLLILTETE